MAAFNFHRLLTIQERSHCESNSCHRAGNPAHRPTFKVMILDFLTLSTSRNSLSRCGHPRPRVHNQPETRARKRVSEPRCSAPVMPLSQQQKHAGEGGQAYVPQ
ncbi:hypothetical protein BAUCODRAFT_265228 [Baudoinia panamericana UAMH 10762]|uniref:Uncharacterized protein n=1 Tax=Baudoinia panamericana (strain UAMH 10762) TaxID=717646 RepID=M2N1P6_BAUPA|nr:uncharacterized protein BAUCODRAFT_265228 [Baudoinia panamericana UAMH 10762]EMC92884.1 hypothetical protein BAUCODRAFT_265228 [Baudoinia panamericana UAMH 10762]